MFLYIVTGTLYYVDVTFYPYHKPHGEFEVSIESDARTLTFAKRKCLYAKGRCFYLHGGDDIGNITHLNLWQVSKTKTNCLFCTHKYGKRQVPFILLSSDY